MVCKMKNRKRKMTVNYLSGKNSTSVVYNLFDVKGLLLDYDLRLFRLAV